MSLAVLGKPAKPNCPTRQNDAASTSSAAMSAAKTMWSPQQDDRTTRDRSRPHAVYNMQTKTLMQLDSIELVELLLQDGDETLCDAR